MKKDDRDGYVLDTSAILTYIEDEEGSDFVENLLIRAEADEIDIYLAFISLTEVFYITAQEKGDEEAIKRIELLKSLKIKIEESNEDLNLEAGRLKAKNNISLADAYIAALSRKTDGVLVHKDPEFEAVSPSLKERRLPYKK